MTMIEQEVKQWLENKISKPKTYVWAAGRTIASLNTVDFIHIEGRDKEKMQCEKLIKSTN